MGRPAVGSSLYPEMAEEGKQSLRREAGAPAQTGPKAMGQCGCLLARGLARKVPRL